MSAKGLPTIAPYALPGANDLPAPRAPWKLERDRAALLVHDMQNYFLRPFAPDASPLAPVVANIAALAQAARKAGVPVFYTAQEGDQDRRDRGLQADLWGPGMSGAAEHQPILAALAPQPGDKVLVKHRYSAFQRSNLETLLRARGRDQLIITGVYAHIGCTLTAADAFMRDIEPFMVADALADFSRVKHDLALSYVADTCGVPVMTARILEAL
ncbi:bifunctional isochorismate lyase/aryl carrier protein [Ancylobacter aquaticus]|uniref:Bifunctional isochorismate lyase/aryl carrier protein n=1 Tax=Ancylobacter aquaticus TaxID=100 RepID=A0A4R1I1Q3_ANCAQ|nr:isochorismatase family protein [Ancylobacter aquaticus]TCK23852.1 bifunctional isochorismate lyase/aryl carrier protein [Ancylobacter aquaticus]